MKEGFDVVHGCIQASPITGEGRKVDAGDEAGLLGMAGTRMPYTDDAVLGLKTGMKRELREELHCGRPDWSLQMRILQEIRQSLRQRMHDAAPETEKWVRTSCSFWRSAMRLAGIGAGGFPVFAFCILLRFAKLGDARGS